MRDRKLLRGEEMVLSIEFINITSFDQNRTALTSSKAKIIFFQEHKVRKRERKKHRRELHDLGWKVHFGPCDETSKVAAAGIGAMWKDDEVHVYPEKMQDDDLVKARSLGRAGKYIVNVGWESNYVVYPIYGKVAAPRRR